jgi:acyl-CoA thioester hydrolase
VFDLAVRVYYEDTDAGGVVYHSQYLNFMERARTEWLRALGYSQTILREQQHILFVVHSMQVQFRRPARFDDLLLVSSRLLRLGRGSFECQQTISCNQQLLIEAEIKIACVDANSFKPTGIPIPIKTAMESTWM